LTEGSLNPHRILRIQGVDACQLYLMSEIQQVYRSQGQNIHDKHFEVIIRKMLSKVQVTNPHDSNYLPGDVFDRIDILATNEALLAEGKQPARYVNILLGITKASLTTDSFLSASSFQHTIKVLAKAAIGSDEDPLYGLKENVIIGKLIPAGSGFVPGRFAAEAAEAEFVALMEKNVEDEDEDLDEFDDDDLDDDIDIDDEISEDVDDEEDDDEEDVDVDDDDDEEDIDD